MSLEYRGIKLELYDMNEIRMANELAGYHFFSKSAIKFFNSIIPDTAIKGPGGIFFTTSERFRNLPNRYTVRKFSADGHVATVGEFGQFTSRNSAITEMKKLASGIS